MALPKTVVEKSPDAYRSIGEAATEIGLQTHVLRYWEGKFPRHIKPVKRKDGRRMFRQGDIHALRAIQILVHERGLTLKGAKLILDEQGVDAVLNGLAMLVAGADSTPVSPARELQQVLSDVYEGSEAGSRQRLKTVLSDMSDLKSRLDAIRLRSAA